VVGELDLVKAKIESWIRGYEKEHPEVLRFKVRKKIKQ
jgi:hypothetical protein